MPPSRPPELDALFARLERIDIPTVARGGPPRRRSFARTLLRWLATAVIVIALPFAVLVRAGTLLYQAYDFPTAAALAGAGAITLAILTAYAAWLAKRVTGRHRAGVVARWVALPLLITYCGYALIHVADANTKTDQVRAYYRSLHPLLRIAVSTLILADDRLVITDAARTLDDYAAMGLPVYAASLHFEQPDGYVHALDLRTLGRAAWQNWMMQAYFRAMGFRTVRHVGTADHLHVSLPPR